MQTITESRVILAVHHLGGLASINDIATELDILTNDTLVSVLRSCVRQGFLLTQVFTSANDRPIVSFLLV